jgi:hypothetical protein
LEIAERLFRTPNAADKEALQQVPKFESAGAEVINNVERGIRSRVRKLPESPAQSEIKDVINELLDSVESEQT